MRSTGVATFWTLCIDCVGIDVDETASVAPLLQKLCVVEVAIFE